MASAIDSSSVPSIDNPILTPSLYDFLMYLGGFSTCLVLLCFVVVVIDKFDSSFATLVLQGAPAGTVFHT